MAFLHHFYDQLRNTAYYEAVIVLPSACFHIFARMGIRPKQQLYSSCVETVWDVSVDKLCIWTSYVFISWINEYTSTFFNEGIVKLTYLWNICILRACWKCTFIMICCHIIQLLKCFILVVKTFLKQLSSRWSKNRKGKNIKINGKYWSSYVQ